MTSTKYTVVYIAGYGRSGSTLLERLLCAHPGVVGMGEIAYLGDGGEADAFIREVRDSPKWTAVFAQLERSPGALEYLKRRQKARESLCTGWLYWLGGHKQYSRHVKSIFDAVRATQGDQVRFLIDSSKTARDRFFRPLLLAGIDGVDLKVIHLLRDPRGCLFSTLRGSNKLLERGQRRRAPLAGLRACVGWCLANASALLFALRHGRGRYLQLSYDELVENPAAALDRVGAFLHVDYTQVQRRLAAGEPIPPADQFAGNRLRRQSAVVLRKDDEWREKLNWPYRLTCWIVCWPIRFLAGALR